MSTASFNILMFTALEVTGQVMKWSKKQHFASETREDKMSHGVVI